MFSIMSRICTFSASILPLMLTCSMSAWPRASLWRSRRFRHSFAYRAYHLVLDLLHLGAALVLERVLSLELLLLGEALELHLLGDGVHGQVGHVA
jgi:hypothetical protein